MDWSNETLGSVISFNRTRIYGGIPQNALAERVGVSPQYINDIENDRRTPSDEVLAKLAEELHVPDDYLYWMAGRIPPDLRLFEKDPIFVMAGLVILRQWLAKRREEERMRLGARSISDAMERVSASLENLAWHTDDAKNALREYDQMEAGK